MTTLFFAAIRYWPRRVTSRIRARHWTLKRRKRRTPAAPCTLNCLELSNHKTPRGHKLPHDPVAVADCLLTLGTRYLPKHAPEVVLDLDAMGHYCPEPASPRATTPRAPFKSTSSTSAPCSSATACNL